MDPNLQTQLQAWVDGELRGAEADAAARRAASDPEARALCENLRSIQRLLRDNPPHRPCPETRDFYWSGIRRRIEPAAAAARPAAAPSKDRLPGWLAWLIPAGAFALAVAVFMRPEAQPSLPDEGVAKMSQAMVNHYIEAPATSVTTLTFYSAQDALTVVWVGHVDLL